MSAISGTGGYISVAGSPDVRVDIQRWVLNLPNRIAEITSSADTASKFKGTIPDATIQISLLADDTTYPETSGLSAGTTINLSLKLGTLAKFHNFTSTTVESVNTTDDSTQDVIRMEVTCRGGEVALYQNAVL